MTVSKCCHATVHVEGRTTMFYVCDQCGKACDVVQWDADKVRDSEFDEDALRDRLKPYRRRRKGWP